MLKARIILIGLGLLAVVVLYTLPKVLVKNQNSTQTQPGEDTSADVHTPTLPEDVREKSSSLRKLLATTTGKEKAQWADSLIGFYSDQMMLDSAAWIAEQLATEAPSVTRWLKTGDLYYEAYTFAIDESKQAKMAEKARIYFQKVLDADPKQYTAKTKMAMTYVSSANPMQGILMLREVLDKDPNNEEALYNLGMLSLQTGQYSKAAERFEKLVSVNAAHIQGRFYLGVCYTEMKQKDQARAQFLKVKELQSDPAVNATVDSYLERIK